MCSERQLLIATYRAFNRRDIDAVLAVMHAGVDWPNAIRMRGHAGVHAY
jgi:hypothetical protein